MKNLASRKSIRATAQPPTRRAGRMQARGCYCCLVDDSRRAREREGLKFRLTRYIKANLDSIQFAGSRLKLIQIERERERSGGRPTERKMESETAASPRRLPKIDFSDVDPANPGTRSWDAVRARVMQAMESDGCFEAVYPRVSSQLRDFLFGTALKELFALPLETKLQNISDKPFHGYLGQIPYLSYESLAIMDAPFPYGAQSFTSLMWPNGNSTFCETVQSFSEQVMELEMTIRRMVLESLGVEKYCVAQTESTRFLIRVSEYGTPQGEEEKKLGLVPHRDKNTLAIVCQNQVDGLEMETKDGEWIPATPSSASFIVIAGDAFRAWTNGRVYSPLHRIVVGGDATRYSAIMFSVPKDDVVIQAPPELVDEQHPSLFRPFLYNKYVHYCVSEEAMKVKCQLDAYCGVAAENLEMQGDGA